MRVDRVLRLADRLDATPDEMFYMGLWFSRPKTRTPDLTPHVLRPLLQLVGCGTAACVAGHCSLMRRGVWRGRNEEREWLGISRATADRLFQPTYSVGECPVPMDYLAAAEAAATVRYLGEEYQRSGREVVDWWAYTRRHGRVDRSRTGPPYFRFDDHRVRRELPAPELAGVS